MDVFPGDALQTKKKTACAVTLTCKIQLVCQVMNLCQNLSEKKNTMFSNSCTGFSRNVYFLKCLLERNKYGVLCIVNRRNNYKEDNKNNVKSVRGKINLFPRLSRREFA